MLSPRHNLVIFYEGPAAPITAIHVFVVLLRRIAVVYVISTLAADFAVHVRSSGFIVHRLVFPDCRDDLNGGLD